MTFMTTFRLPANETPLSLLVRYDSLLNAGGPVGPVERAVPIVELDGWRLTADVHFPTTTMSTGAPAPVLLFLHGGGWTMGSPASHDRLARELAARGFLTVSVDYPRAPRRRFPAGYDGCLAALRWAARVAERYGGDASRLVVAGDSAGANLAAAVAVSPSADRPEITAAALMYGIYDFHEALPVLEPLIGGADAATQLYLPPPLFEDLTRDPRLSPRHAAAALPPCWLGVGTADPLLGETQALAAELSRLGRPHELYLAPGAPHSFLQMPFLAACRAGLDSAAAFLHDSVNSPEPSRRYV